MYKLPFFPEPATVPDTLLVPKRWRASRRSMKDGNSTRNDGMRFQSTMRLAFSRLVSVTMSLCALAFLPLPQHAMLTLVEAPEAECPVQEEGERSKEELVVRSPARRRSNDRIRCGISRSRKTCVCFQQSVSCAVCLPAIVGHQIANELRAPLLI